MGAAPPPRIFNSPIRPEGGPPTPPVEALLRRAMIARTSRAPQGDDHPPSRRIAAVRLATTGRPQAIASYSLMRSL